MASQNRTFKTTLAVTMVILLSKLFGFARDVISAGYFGTGMERDACSSAYTLFYIPVLLFNSCITSTVVPLYVQARNKHSRRLADRFASNCVNIFALLALGVALLMMALAGPLVRITFGGFDQQKQMLTAQLTQIMLPSLSFVVVSIVLSSVLNANERYLSAQLTGFPLTVAVIIATVGFSRQYGIWAVAWGVFAAGVLQMLILLPFANRTMGYSFRLQFNDPQFKRMLVLAVPAILSMAVNELNHIIDKSICSYLNPGDPSAMDYAYRLITFATGVLAVPITTVMFSRLSMHATQGDRKGALGILNQSVEALTIILLPVTLIGCVLATDVIKLAYMHGSFGEDSLRVTSGVFLFYLLGIWGFGLRDMYNRAFHAMQDTRTPMLVACLTVALNVGLNLTLSRVMGVNGLALATTISCMVGAVVLAVMLRKRLGHIGFRKTALELGKVMGAGALCLAAALVLNQIWPQALGKGWVLLRLAGIGCASLLIYVGALVTLRVEQLAFVKGLLLRRRS